MLAEARVDSSVSILAHRRQHSDLNSRGRCACVRVGLGTSVQSANFPARAKLLRIEVHSQEEGARVSFRGKCSSDCANVGKSCPLRAHQGAREERQARRQKRSLCATHKQLASEISKNHKPLKNRQPNSKRKKWARDSPGCSLAQVCKCVHLHPSSGKSRSDRSHPTHPPVQTPGNSAVGGPGGGWRLEGAAVG